MTCLSDSRRKDLARSRRLPRIVPAMRHMIAVALAVLLLPSAMLGQAVEPVLARVKQERALSDHAKQVYAELGKTLAVALVGTGATDAAIAALESRAAVIEGFGLLGFGSHSNNASTFFSALSSLGSICSRG